ncbi:MAG: D-glycero-alpha-D-manno-heptose-1,7-bisphosphate 7-phosphatase [Steroidobacterales bacterium]
MIGSARADKVVVLDRDGTVVFDREYLSDPAGLKFLPGAAEGLRRLHELGYRLVVVTNQSGVGRGVFSLDRLQAMNQRLIEMVRSTGAELSGIYYCPHAPDAGCECRKPATGLLLQAASDLGFKPSCVIVIGDKRSDVEFGRRAGATTILVSAEAASAAHSRAARTDTPDFVVRDLVEAAQTISELGPTAHD